jgi:hypothetical protein
MGVVIGAGTTVSVGTGSGACITSVSWGYNHGRQDVYCLGSWSPSEDHSVSKPSITVNISAYAGSGITYTCTPTEDCVDAPVVDVSVSAKSCGGGAGGSGVAGGFHVQSYSFSKDSGDQPGQESWGMIKWKNVGGKAPVIEPSYVIITAATGESSGSGTGVTIDDPYASGFSGSVSAGGVGNFNETEVGTVSSVGGSSTGFGWTGTGSASITLTPLYI